MYPSQIIKNADVQLDVNRVLFFNLSLFSLLCTSSENRGHPHERTKRTISLLTEKSMFYPRSRRQGLPDATQVKKQFSSSRHESAVIFMNRLWRFYWSHVCYKQSFERTIVVTSLFFYELLVLRFLNRDLVRISPLLTHGFKLIITR